MKRSDWDTGWRQSVFGGQVDPYSGKKLQVNNSFLWKKLTPDLCSVSWTFLLNFKTFYMITTFASPTEEGGALTKHDVSKTKMYILPQMIEGVTWLERKRRGRLERMWDTAQRIICLPQLIAWLGRNKWSGSNKLSKFPVFHCNTPAWAWAEVPGLGWQKGWTLANPGERSYWGLSLKFPQQTNY